MLAVHELEIRVGARLLMEDVSFRVEKGDKIGLVGANGAGKSSLFAILRNELHALKDWEGLLTTYVADKEGNLAHTMGIYANKGKTTEMVGTIKEPGF